MTGCGLVGAQVWVRNRDRGKAKGWLGGGYNFIFVGTCWARPPAHGFPYLLYTTITFRSIYQIQFPFAGP